MHHDPISDFLTRIRNANLAKLPRVAIPSSKMKLNILKILKDEGYIADYSMSEKYHGVIKIYLKYDNSGKPMISTLQRMSRPGRRYYSKSNQVPESLNGFGITIVSTSKGMMTDKEAKKLNVGGEVICKVW
jgi:small subunit ribosomal protein S8